MHSQRNNAKTHCDKQNCTHLFVTVKRTAQDIKTLTLTVMSICSLLGRRTQMVLSCFTEVDMMSSVRLR